MSSATAERLVQGLKLEDIFELDNFLTDLREGVVANQNKNRVCLLSTDLLSGIYKALLEEAGPAWGLMFKNCGMIWGQRLAKKLSAESEVLVGKPYQELPVPEFLEFVQRYFSFHGWGILQLNIEDVETRGLVQATLKHSIFPEVVEKAEPEEMVDHMIAGILGAIMSYVSGHDLDCLQTACSSNGEEYSRFVITSRDRVENLEELVEDGLSHAELLEKA